MIQKMFKLMIVFGILSIFMGLGSCAISTFGFAAMVGSSPEEVKGVSESVGVLMVLGLGGLTIGFVSVMIGGIARYLSKD